MIGLIFMAVGIIWLALSWYLATRLPQWLSIQRPFARWSLSTILLLVLLVGPFVDHIVGMWQFERLCAEETRLQISPAAVNTKRARGLDAQSETLEGYVIPINRQIRRIVDLDTGEQIAQYKYFSTPGGSIGGLLMLGGRYTCSAKQRGHIDEKKYDALAAQTNLTFGEAK